MKLAENIEIMYGEISESFRVKLMGHLSGMDIRITTHPENFPKKNHTYLKLDPSDPLNPGLINVYPFYKTSRVIYDASRLNGYYHVRQFDGGNFNITKKDMPILCFMTTNPR